MGSNLTILGYTVSNTTPTREWVAAAFDTYASEILMRRDQWDEMETFEEDDILALQTLADAALKMHAPDNHSMSYTVGEDRLFLVMGGETYGDPPFEDYPVFEALANICDLIPEFGRLIEIYGTGIAIPEALL